MFTGNKLRMNYFLNSALTFIILVMAGCTISVAQTLKPSLAHDLTSGTVTNEKGDGVSGTIEFLDPVTDKLAAKATLDANGEYKLLLPKNRRFYFLIRNGAFTYFFKDENHITETSKEAIETELEISFQVYQVSKGSSIILHDLNFGSNLFDIIPAHISSLKYLADFLKKHPKIKIQVAGHTDNVGKEEENKILSQKRADSVMNYLVSKEGISQDRINSFGYGPSRPLTTNTTSEGRAINRRTSFIISAGE